jgi:hypothetical protein
MSPVKLDKASAAPKAPRSALSRALLWWRKLPRDSRLVLGHGAALVLCVGCWATCSDLLTTYQGALRAPLHGLLWACGTAFVVVLVHGIAALDRYFGPEE